MIGLCLFYLVLFVCVCICLVTYVYIRRPEEDIGCFTLELFTLVYKIPYLSVCLSAQYSQLFYMGPGNFNSYLIAFIVCTFAHSTISPAPLFDAVIAVLFNCDILGIFQDLMSLVSFSIPCVRWAEKGGQRWLTSSSRFLIEVARRRYFFLFCLYVCVV